MSYIFYACKGSILWKRYHEKVVLLLCQITCMYKKRQFVILRASLSLCFAVCTSFPAYSATKSRCSLLHYWDNYPFQDTLVCQQPDSLKLKVTDFMKQLSMSSHKDRLQAVSRMLDMASVSKQAYDFITRFSGSLLYDHAEFIGQDEVYSIVLRHMINSNMLSDIEKVRPRFRLELLGKNAVGQTATDFSFVMRNGREMSLYKMPETIAKLIIFFDPLCIRCQALINTLRSNTVLNGAINGKKLQVLAVCISEDVPSWERVKNDLPGNWIVGLGHDEILNQQLYDLHDFPVIYFLDKSGKVIQKNIPANRCIEFMKKDKTFISTISNTHGKNRH